MDRYVYETFDSCYVHILLCGACTHLFEILLVLHDLSTMIHFCILFISLSAVMIWIFDSDFDIYVLLFYIVSEAYISPYVDALSLESLYRI